jgi:hypothetical protein
MAGNVKNAQSEVKTGRESGATMAAGFEENAWTWTA